MPWSAFIPFTQFFRANHLLEPWEENELKTFIRKRSLDYWKLYDVTNQQYLHVESGHLRAGDTFHRSFGDQNSDEMYWTRSGDDLIENKATGGHVEVKSCWARASTSVKQILLGSVLYIDDDTKIIDVVHLGLSSHPRNCKWIACSGLTSFTYKWSTIAGKIANYGDPETFVGYNRNTGSYCCDGFWRSEFKAVQPDTESEIHAIRAERYKLEERIRLLEAQRNMQMNMIVAEVPSIEAYLPH